MGLSMFAGLTVLCASLALADNPDEPSKVICYYNSTTYMDPEFGTFGLYHLQRALKYCTHLIYGYAGIHPTENAPMSLQQYFDLQNGRSLWAVTIGLKKSHPGLKVKCKNFSACLLQRRQIETAEARSEFVRSAFGLIKQYGFDGIDLAWQFPIEGAQEHLWSFEFSPVPLISERRGFYVASEKKTIRREGFSALVRDFKNTFKSHSLDVTVTVLPHLQTSDYYEPRFLAENADAIQLMAFDQRNPKREPNIAGYPAPMYDVPNGRTITADVNSTITYWIEQGAPSHKIVLGIPTFARTWKLTDESGTTGLPPVEADGPGAAGPLTKTPGILSYAEVCSRLARKSVDRVRRVADPSKSLGTYAFLPYNRKTGTDGIWIGYEDPDTAAIKAAYARNMGLGGVAIFDLSTDDFHHICTPDEFPIVRAAAIEFRNPQP